MHDAGVWVLKPEYIADYLILQPKPPTFDYVLDELADEAPPPPLNQSQQRKRKAAADTTGKAKPTQKRSKR